MMPEKKARKTWSLVTRSSPLPGFRLSMGFTLTYLTVIVLSPLMAILLHGARLGFGAFPHTVTAPRLMASYRVTLVSAAVAAPLYGTILAASRSIGEFGAVQVVSGHIRGQTTTQPLEVQMLYNGYNFTAAFAAASLLTLAAIVTLVLKKIIEVTSGVHQHIEEKEVKS